MSQEPDMSAPEELWIVLRDGSEPMIGVYANARAAANSAANYERNYDRSGAYYEETRYVLAEKSVRASPAPQAESADARVREALRELVDALDATAWSSWQTLASFSKQWDAARAALSPAAQQPKETP